MPICLHTVSIFLPKLFTISPFTEKVYQSYYRFSNFTEQGVLYNLPSNIFQCLTSYWYEFFFFILSQIISRYNLRWFPPKLFKAHFHLHLHVTRKQEIGQNNCWLQGWKQPEKEQWVSLTPPFKRGISHLYHNGDKSRLQKTDAKDQMYKSTGKPKNTLLGQTSESYVVFPLPRTPFSSNISVFVQFMSKCIQMLKSPVRIPLVGTSKAL